MNMKKILAAAVASVMAVSTMAVAAFAATTIEVPANPENDWHDVEVFKDEASLKALIGDHEIAEIDTIVLKSDGTKIGVGYHGNDADKTWHQADSEDALFFTETLTIKAADISLDATKCYLKAFAEAGTADPSELTVDFTFKAAEATTAAPAGTTAAGTQKPAGSTEVKDPAKGDAPNTGIEGVAVVAGLAVLAAGAIVVAKKRK